MEYVALLTIAIGLRLHSSQRVTFFEFPSSIQIIEIQDRVEDQEVGGLGLAAPHWIR